MSSKLQLGNCRRVGLWGLVLLAPWMECAAQRWHGSIGASTDYVWRGVSQTQSDPAFQAALHVSGSRGWYAGAWANAALDQESQHRYRVSRYQLDLFAGYRKEISDDWLLDLSVIRYSYPGDRRPLEYDYTEFTATLSFAGRASLLVAISPDISMYTSRGRAVDQTAVAMEMALVQPIVRRISLTGGIGYYHLGELFSTGYMYWNAGLVVDVGRMAIDVTHIAADQRGRDLFGEGAAGPRTVLSVIVGF